MRPRMGSLFSGIGGFDEAFRREGFEVAWQVEIEPFPRKVLSRHFPESERFKDVQECGSHNLSPVDVICAGVPCQDVSIAGRRAGLAGERTGLFYEFARILRELRPDWFVFENVPGLLSVNAGRDFGEILRVLMVECGYGVSWRVLDSQHFGIPQRRRVFVVGRLGRPVPPEILFESCGRSGDSAPGREARTDTAGAPNGGAGGAGNAPGRRREDDVNLIAATLRASGGSPRGDGQDNLVAATLPADHRRTTDSNVDNLQVFNWNKSPSQAMRVDSERCDPLQASEASNPAVLTSGVRRLTPVECERLQGFPDGWSIPYEPDGDLLPLGLDSPRYRALGNAVSVPVAQWIAGRLLAQMEELIPARPP